MSRTVKILLTVFGIVVVLGAVVWGAWRWFSHQALPRTSGTVRVPGISQTVEIVRDEYGVPHIYADTPGDLFFAQGYVHAQDRFWQMEFQRRVGAARLSEVFGESTLGTDTFLRHFGFADLANQAYQMMDAETQEVVDAYTAGINAYIRERSPSALGLEFALLGLQGVSWEIEPWTPADSLVWAEMLIYDQGGSANTDLSNLQRLATQGESRFADLLPPYRDDRPVIIPSEELDYLSNSPAPAGAARLTQAEVDYVLGLLDQGANFGLSEEQRASLGLLGSAGSNSFVVSGDLTASGMPILANDPHMSVNMPALWYEIGGHCREKSDECPYNFRGFSLPGVPGILIGHNDRIAWGLTNASFDAEDVFIERLNPENPDQYEVNGEWVDMDIRLEEIQVRGREEPVVITVRSTRNGLIVTDRMVDAQPFSYQAGEPDLYALSFAWTALQPVRSAEAVFKVIRAQDWDEFVAALELFEAGKQNWIFADVDGNIGYVMPGKVPVRAGGDGTLPVPGWTDDYIWTGFIPYEDAPRTFNPEQGFVVTANNPQVRAEDYPYLLNTRHDRGQRAERLTNLIEQSGGGLTVADLARFQTDNTSLSALEIVPYLRGLEFSQPEMETARNALLNWDGGMRLDSSEAALFNIFWAHLLDEIYSDDLPEDLMPSGESYASDYVAALLPEPEAGWWDDRHTPGEQETRDDILVRAFEAAYQEGVSTFGENLTDWRWGDLHTITFTNATLGESGIAIIENLFNRGPFPTHGSESVPQKTCWSTNSPYQVRCIPALRQVVDLGDLSSSRMIQSVGQSGHPMSRHYGDFIETWRELQYHPSNWTRAEAEAGRHDTLVLEPAN